MLDNMDRISFKHIQYEIVGTFLLVFLGGWSRMTVEVIQSNYMETALAMGLLFSALATLAMTTSGGHYNPMITISLMFVNQISMPKCLSYVLAHIIGSLLGAGFLAYTASAEMLDAARQNSVLGMPSIGKDFGQITSFFSEFIGSILIMGMYWVALKEDKISPQIKGYLNGVGIMVSTICCYKVSGAAFNPMLVFGPSLISRTIKDFHWIYWFGPLMGCLSTCVVLDTMEKMKKVIMSKKKVIKKKEALKMIEMDTHDQEYEERKRLEKLDTGTSERNYELSDDDGIEKGLGDIKEEEYEGSEDEQLTKKSNEGPTELAPIDKSMLSEMSGPSKSEEESDSD